MNDLEGRNGRIHESRGRWFNELEVGDVFLHRPHRTVTESDNVFFTAVTMNTQSLHLDQEFAAATEFGRPLVNSMFTLALVVGLGVSDLTERTIVANLGFGEIRFPNPVHHGDTIAASSKVLAKRASRSRPGQGIVEFEHVGRNQRGDIVCLAHRSALFHSGSLAEG